MEKNQPKRNWRVLFAGTPTYAVPSLEAILAIPGVDVVGVLTQKAKPRGRGKTVQPSPVEIFATAHNLLVLTPDRLRTTETLALVLGLDADVGVVVAYGKILPQVLLDGLPYGWVNAHASLLPRWRGASPIQQTILAGDAESGVTLMQLDAGMDTGPILQSEKVVVAKDETSIHLAENLSRVSAKLFRRYLVEYIQGKLQAHPQPSTGITLAPQIEKTDGVLLPSETASILERKIRAYTPWPGTSLQLGTLHCKILEASVQSGIATIGEILPAPSGFKIGTAEGFLVPLRLQVPGKKPMSSAEFARGYARQIWPH